jgi:hypothetical protein
LKSLRLALLVLLVFGAAPALRAEAVPGLIFAHVRWVETKSFFQERPDDLYEWNYVKFRIYEEYIGKIGHKEIYGYIKHHSYPRSEEYSHFYIFGIVDKNGELMVYNWTRIGGDNCIHRGVAEYFGVLNELVDLRAKGRLPRAIACDW